MRIFIDTELGRLTAVPGSAQPFGATVAPNGGLNFSLYSAHGEQCVLVLFRRGAGEPLAEIVMPPESRMGHVFALRLEGVDADQIEYAYRVTGPYQPVAGHRFEADRLLLDPFAQRVTGRDVWGDESLRGRELRGQIVTELFDWEGDRPLNLPFQDLVTYEMHVRSFTQHPSSGVRHPGTYDGMVEKIEYLRDLGINCVELLPIQEFDEFEGLFVNPLTGEELKQYWGYGSLGFFAPKAGFAASAADYGQVNELKTLIKALHKAGIEVFMDVVFNHTGEGDEGGHTVSFRGIDNKVYYMLSHDGRYHNYSGTGNTLNCNHPVVREYIVDCLRFWVMEYHIDGFRFDLASVLTRDEQGHVLSDPPLVAAIAKDPILAQTKIVAEAWDAAGLYQVGSFPDYGRWSEWNGRYRDTVRRFLIGSEGEAGNMVQRLIGSPDMYQGRPTYTSVNFINCHDGFTLADMFAYNAKHNEANGEDNRDGSNDNNSWNCGVEGPTNDYNINRVRYRLMRSAFAILMVSQGVPLFHMGDEVGFSKQGNNNTYGQDNELNWFDWGLVEQNTYMFRFCQQMIAFRNQHKILRHIAHLGPEGDDAAKISWHGVKALSPDWSYHSHTLAFMLDGREMDGGEWIYVAINMHHKAHVFEIPPVPDGGMWHLFCDTGRRSPHDIVVPGQEHVCGGQKEYVVESRGVVILVGR